ncbi:MAG: hypothetical protein ACJ771_04625 [Chloroflexota bacterium]
MNGKRNDSMRTWIAISVPVIVLVLVVAFGVVGKAFEPSPKVMPSVAESAAVATPTSSPVPAPTAEPIPVVGAVCEPQAIRFDPTETIDLTGAWAGDDGGVYYVRELGTVIWWNGMSSRDAAPTALGRNWNNVGRGEIQKDLSIQADWVDVPRGGIAGSGTVVFQIGPDAAGNLQITKTSETGTGRGDALWTPCAPDFLVN